MRMYTDALLAIAFGCFVFLAADGIIDLVGDLLGQRISRDQVVRKPCNYRSDYPTADTQDPDRRGCPRIDVREVIVIYGVLLEAR